RPTSDKVKESLFNAMGQFFSGGRVLDLYAGSGALGLEAVSRGYDSAVFVDINYAACEIIKKNILLTKEKERFEIFKNSDLRAISILASRNYHFDLVFLEKIIKVMKIMLDANILNEKALIVAETDENVELPDVEGYSLINRHHLGRTKFKIYERK
ncbi:MAG: 16S rRNA (guanine(966)-N(2))-methyltransferase RsmD, partial [Lactobacillus iners]|nr:16S rRNA (guanine(966)-N(2))-methyltransferase RsmD [Lactobacillus iners]